MIECREVQFDYGDRFALHVPTLSVAAGEAIALVGPSGSGKTTLLNLLAGILTPRSGEVLIDGLSIGSMDDAQRRRFRLNHIGFVFQDIALLDYLNVLDNILLPGRIGRTGDSYSNAKSRTSEGTSEGTSGGASGSSLERAKQLAQAVGLKDRLKRWPAALSQGERQRVGICRALVTDPKVILADEPTSSLDAETASDVMDAMFALVKSSGATLVMLTHDRTLLDRFDRVLNVNEFTAATADRAILAGQAGQKHEDADDVTNGASSGGAS